jgi:hypothetical protein
MQLIRPTLVVVGEDVGDVLGAAGGWIADQVWAGWIARAGVRSRGHETALRVVGADCASINEITADHRRPLHPHAIAVSADSCRRDEHIRRWVINQAAAAGGEVRMWGAHIFDEFQLATKVIEHRLSRAALQFKRQALVTAGIPDEAGTVEAFITVLNLER